jgi:hypothetical protein
MSFIRLVLLSIACGLVCANHVQAPSVRIGCNQNYFTSIILSLFGLPSIYFQCTAQATNPEGILEINLAASIVDSTGRTRFAIITDTDRQVYSGDLPTQATLTVTFQILDWFPSGTYQVNALAYGEKWKNVISQQSEILVLASSQHQDTTAPELTSLVIPTPIAIYATNYSYFTQVNLTVFETGSGLSKVAIKGVNASDTVSALGTWVAPNMYNRYNGVVISVSLYLSIPLVDTFSLIVTLTDQANNSRTYNASDLQDGAFPHVFHCPPPPFLPFFHL